MNKSLVKDVNRIIGLDSIKKRMEEFFLARGIELDHEIYPPVLRDFVQLIPALKLEIQPHIDDIDPTTGNVLIAWNLFIFGVERMFLGYSLHDSLAHLERMIGSNDSASAIRRVTANDIIKFIMDMIDSKDSKYCLMASNINNVNFNPTVNDTLMPYGGIFFERSKITGNSN